MVDSAILAQHNTVTCVFTPEETQHSLFIPLVPILLPGCVARGTPLSSALKLIPMMAYPIVHSS